MGNNIKTQTIFCDLDGCIVHHNYAPLILEDKLLPGAIDFLLKHSLDCYIVLTTARSKIECSKILKILYDEYRFVFDKTLFNLPLGTRFVLNDYRYLGKNKAVAVNVNRNEGLENINLKKQFSEIIND